jgi:HlyD family secretion protein
MSPPISRPSLRPLVAVALVLALAAGVAGCQKKAAESPRQQARAVSVVSVEPHTIEGGLVASGGLMPREDMAVFSQLTGYRVAQVLVDEGTWVKAEQPLARLDDTLLRAQLAQQTALAAQARVAANRADEEAGRVKGLDNEGLLSQEQVDDRRFAAQAARAQATAQEAAASDVRTREGLMVIRAPSAGLVIERNVRPGDSGGGPNPWFRIAKDGQIELSADVGEAVLGKLRPGVAARVTLADGTEIPGVVRLVSPGVDAATKLGKVRVSLPVRPDVRAGGFAHATFAGAAQSSLAVPETAVRYDADGASVLTIGADEKVVRAPVTTGGRGGGFVELVTGPPAGTLVVERASAMLTPGDFVRPVGSK